MRHLMILLCVVVLAVSPVFAGSLTFTGPGAFGLQIMSTAPLLATPVGATVSGTIVLSPPSALSEGLTSTFYLDNQAKLVSELARPEFMLDTAKLSEGLHEVRLDVLDGTRLAFSTGAIPLHVMRDIAVNALRQDEAGEPPFAKVYRKMLLREIVWFDNREADLEKHAFVSGGRVYITLTDLLRHVGGTIIWGPSEQYVLVERNGRQMRFVPGTSRVIVNGVPKSLGSPSRRIDNRLFVPIGPVLKLLDLQMTWNRIQGRAYVNTKG
jgi:hypothetical protein